MREVTDLHPEISTRTLLDKLSALVYYTEYIMLVQHTNTCGKQTHHHPVVDLLVVTNVYTT